MSYCECLTDTNWIQIHRNEYVFKVSSFAELNLSSWIAIHLTPLSSTWGPAGWSSTSLHCSMPPKVFLPLVSTTFSNTHQMTIPVYVFSCILYSMPFIVNFPLNTFALCCTLMLYIQKSMLTSILSSPYISPAFM